MRELFIKLNCHFSDTDKEECITTIYRIIDLSNLARKKGILALESEMEQEQSFFLKTALSLIVDGTDPTLAKQILQNIILADEYSGSQLLNRLLMAEGVLALQQGENPRIIALKLSAMLGEKYIALINESIFAEESGTAKLYNFLRTLKDKKPLPECIRFESKLIQLDNRSIQLILRSIDRRHLLPALHGCGFDLIRKIFENCSLSTCRAISENWELTKPLRTESILRSQEEILKTIIILEDGGEIIRTPLQQ